MRYTSLCLWLSWALCVGSTAASQEADFSDDRECASVIDCSGRVESRLLRDDEAHDHPRLKPPRNIIPMRPAVVAAPIRTVRPAAEFDEWAVLFEHESGVSLAIASASEGWMAFGMIPTSRGETRRYTVLCTEDRISLCALDRGEKWEVRALGLEWLNGAKKMLTSIASVTSARGFRRCASSLVKHRRQADDSISPNAEPRRPSNQSRVVCDFLAIVSSMLRPRETAVETIEFGPFGPSSLRTYVSWESNRFAYRRLELESIAADCRNSLDRNSPLSSLVKFVTYDGIWSEADTRNGPDSFGLRPLRED